jgi:serine/threonine protein kinase
VPNTRTRSHLRAGDLVQRFRIRSLAGAGGFATVYFVEDEVSGAPYVLKLLAAKFAKSAVYRERFARETRALETIGTHRNIVGIVTAGTTPIGGVDTPFYVMDALHGCTLGDYVRDHGPLAQIDAVSIAVQLLEALEHVHARGIVHRDVKPENIFLAIADARWCVKLLDFGISRWSGPDNGVAAHLTSARSFLGTPRWAAPEQFLGERIEAQADLYSVGLLLFWMIVGRSAFDEQKGAFALSAAHIYELAPRLRQVVSSVPEGLDDLVARALAKKATERPCDAADFRRRLQTIASGLPPSANRLPADLLALSDATDAHPARSRSMSSFVLNMVQRDAITPETGAHFVSESSPFETRPRTGPPELIDAAPQTSRKRPSTALALWRPWRFAVAIGPMVLAGWWWSRDTVAVGHAPPGDLYEPRATRELARPVAAPVALPVASEQPSETLAANPLLLDRAERTNQSSRPRRLTAIPPASPAATAAPALSVAPIEPRHRPAADFAELLTDDTLPREPAAPGLVAGELLSD